MIKFVIFVCIFNSIGCTLTGTILWLYGPSNTLNLASAGFQYFGAAIMLLMGICLLIGYVRRKRRRARIMAGNLHLRVGTVKGVNFNGKGQATGKGFGDFKQLGKIPELPQPKGGAAKRGKK